MFFTGKNIPSCHIHYSYFFSPPQIAVYDLTCEEITNDNSVYIRLEWTIPTYCEGTLIAIQGEYEVLWNGFASNFTLTSPGLSYYLIPGIVAHSDYHMTVRFSPTIPPNAASKSCHVRTSEQSKFFRDIFIERRFSIIIEGKF